MTPDRYRLTAAAAAEALGVTKATLYAYTSRGQLRSEPAPGSSRERRYYRQDIERLRERKETRSDPAKAAARGLHWGGPVLESGITLIENGRLYYRGRDAVKLARTAGLEEVAALLWAPGVEERERLFAHAGVLSARVLARLRSCAKDDALTLLQTALPVAGAVDLKSYDLRPAAVRQTGARILRLLTAIAAGRETQASIHLALQAGWAPGNAAAGSAIRTALVLSADHELNVSAFAARCAASAQASPYDVVSAAMATLKGSMHGGATERVSSLFAETGTPRPARTVLANRLRRGERIPGFGHPLYPMGDPRAALLMRIAAGGNPAEWRLAQSLAKAGGALLHDRPNLDFALVAVARAYGLPERAPFLLFALGRTVGWLAHALEQYAEGNLIRPRAHYTGPAPETNNTVA